MYSDIFRMLTRQLYPIARAFKMPFGGALERFHKALSISEAQAWTDAKAVLDSILPDNANFTAADATDWERRLGIYGNSSTPLADRKAAILRKFNHPGTQIPRQHYKYIEAQLQAAGFDVHVYENRFPTSIPNYYEAQSPNDILGSSISDVAVHSDAVEHGTVEHGGTGHPKIVNYIEEEKDALFLVGSHYRNTFFIAGATITTYADVPLNRKAEFRQLVLWLKPCHAVGYTFVNYV